MQLAVGDYLEGRYVIDRPIARGGMATVYRCVDTRLGRDVAAKVMHEQYVHDPVFRDRFRREARAMAQLSHPNLVNVYDFSSQGETVFLIMELIDGGTLRELLTERGPMPPHAAAAVMRGMLTGLAVAHGKGLIHRDIKPDNILIDSDHRVKLADFGLVRAAADATATTDQIVGTVSYLSPEQVDGSPLTAASDVYSAGIVLFELLTGTTPFTGDSQLGRAYARLNTDVPPPSAFIQGVPKLFDELVATATAREPSDRFHNAAEFLHALEDVAEALGLPAYTVPVPRNAAAHRAAAQPTNVGVHPRAAADQRERAADQSRAADQRLFPQANAPTRAARRVPSPAPAPARVPAPAPAPAQMARPPAAQPPAPQTPQRPPKVDPISNRSAVGFAVFLALALAVTATVAVGAWWFGSGMYGELPPLIAQ